MLQKITFFCRNTITHCDSPVCKLRSKKTLRLLLVSDPFSICEGLQHVYQPNEIGPTFCHFGGGGGALEMILIRCLIQLYLACFMYFWEKKKAPVCAVVEDDLKQVSFPKGEEDLTRARKKLKFR